MTVTEQEEYLIDMAERFEADPKPIEQFMDEQQVPEALRDELEGILKVILLLTAAGRTIRRVVGVES